MRCTEGNLGYALQTLGYQGLLFRLRKIFIYYITIFGSQFFML